MVPSPPEAVEAGVDWVERRSGHSVHRVVRMCRACRPHQVRPVRRVDAGNCSAAGCPVPYRTVLRRREASAVRPPEAEVVAAEAEAEVVMSAAAALSQPAAEGAARAAALRVSVRGASSVAQPAEVVAAAEA